MIRLQFQASPMISNPASQLCLRIWYCCCSTSALHCTTSKVSRSGIAVDSVEVFPTEAPIYILLFLRCPLQRVVIFPVCGSAARGKFHSVHWALDKTRCIHIGECDMDTRQSSLNVLIHRTCCSTYVMVGLNGGALSPNRYLYCFLYTNHYIRFHTEI